MERLLLKPCHEMTTAQCVIECCGYLRTIANQEYNGEEWETAPKYRRQNLITDLLCNIELSGDEFAELCALIGFSIDKVTKQRLSKFMVIAYDYKAETSGTPNAETMATLDKCAGVTLIEERGYHPQGKTFDRIRMMLAGFWHCLLNELRYLCLSVGCVIEPTETADTPAETPRISTKTAETAECAIKSDCRVCSHCGARFHEGYFLGDEYACSDECAIALYGGDRKQFETDLEAEEDEAGTTECYWSAW